MVGNFLEKIWYFLFSNYMWLYLIMGVCSILGFYPMTFQFFMLVTVLFFLHKFANVKNINILDLLVITFLLWILINSIYIDYPHHWKFFYTSVMMNLFPMLFYFIAKTVRYDIEHILSKTTIPMVIAIICGLIFYYTNPDWYVAIKEYQISELYDGDMREEIRKNVYRLSSLWVTPYVIGYSVLFYANYLLYELFLARHTFKEKKFYFILLILTVAVLLLTQFRATIFAFVFSLVYILFFAKNKNRAYSILIICVVVISCLFVYFYESTESGQFFWERMKEGLSIESLEERLESTGGGVNLNTWEGHGFGKYGALAREYDYWAIRDSEYQKVLAELGYIGMIPFVGLIVIGLLMSFLKKNMQLEFTLIMFFAISFVGSSSLSAETTFPFIFWYSLGRISFKSKLTKGHVNL